MLLFLALLLLIARICLCLQDSRAYCQLTGDFVQTLDGFNTRAPVPHMFERCGAMPPAYTYTPTPC
jgi:hypothetical protein